MRRLRLQAGDEVTHEVQPGRGAWLQLIHGALEAEGQQLEPGDGASTEQPGRLTVRATAPSEALLFDLL